MRIGAAYCHPPSLITELEDGSFLRITHDPPVSSLAGQHYSSAFYEQRHRVLRRLGVGFTISATRGAGRDGM